VSEVVFGRPRGLHGVKVIRGVGKKGLDSVLGVGYISEGLS